MQGWKIHISSTILSAGEILLAIGPLLKSAEVLFKAPASLDDLMRINSGIVYGYSQIGKFITIYPRSDSDFTDLVEKLEPLLIEWTANPAVPYDLRFKKTCIYYRFGAFRSNSSVGGIDNGTTRITSPNGVEIDDPRTICPAEISWLEDPLAAPPITLHKPRKNKLNSRYIIHEVLSQRGKGGVYDCLDIGQDPPRRYILKEGRKNGETLWDGRDARSRIRNEARTLRLLADTPARVPHVYDNFRAEGNEYLVLERIEGVDLGTFIEYSRQRMGVREILEICIQMCQIMAVIHKSGLIWRDCKPGNFIIDSSGSVRPIDFEGACSANRPDPLPWSTRFFIPPEMAGTISANGEPANSRQDMFAMGVSLFQLLDEKLPTFMAKDDRFAIGRQGVPHKVKTLISQLMSRDPSMRPDADTACSVIYHSISRLSRQRRGRSSVQSHSIN